jgi:hypothetical protein
MGVQNTQHPANGPLSAVSLTSRFREGPNWLVNRLTAGYMKKRLSASFS